LSGRGLCDELITRPEESYRLWCVVVCDLETSRIGAPYIYDISRLRVNNALTYNKTNHKSTVLSVYSYILWMLTTNIQYIVYVLLALLHVSTPRRCSPGA